MLSQRNTVIALVSSAALVLVLAGVSSGVFTPEAPPSPIGQSVSVHQGDADAVPAPATAPAPPAVPVPLAPAVPVPAAPVPAAPAHHDLAAPAAAAVPSEPVTHYRKVLVQAPVQQQTAPAAHRPVSVEPVQNPRPVSSPPSPALPAREGRSRTANTEPCACDGTMRRVPTHWDPPQS
ncbi:MAG: hypothetical protein ACRDQU_12675 [Pseudonocardiaceae bacterium]